LRPRLGFRPWLAPPSCRDTHRDWCARGAHGHGVTTQTPRSCPNRVCCRRHGDRSGTTTTPPKSVRPGVRCAALGTPPAGARATGALWPASMLPWLLCLVCGLREFRPVYLRRPPGLSQRSKWLPLHGRSPDAPSPPTRSPTSRANIVWYKTVALVDFQHPSAQLLAATAPRLWPIRLEVVFIVTKPLRRIFRVMQTKRSPNWRHLPPWRQTNPMLRAAYLPASLSRGRRNEAPF